MYKIHKSKYRLSTTDRNDMALKSETNKSME